MTVGALLHAVELNIDLFAVAGVHKVDRNIGLDILTTSGCVGVASGASSEAATAEERAEYIAYIAHIAEA